MIWISPKKDQKLQYEKIDESNFTRKNIELLNRMRTYLNNFDDSCSSSKEEIEQGFLEQLNTSPRKNNMRLCFIMNNNLNLYFLKLEDYWYKEKLMVNLEYLQYDVIGWVEVKIKL